MPTRHVVQIALVVALGSSALTAGAEEVTLRRNGLTLNAGLELAAGKSVADGAVLVTHGGLTHRDAEGLVYLRRLLNEKGYSTLAINLSLGIDNRHGMYDCQVTHRHRNADAADEIGAWMDWLKDRGASQVTLLGHSRGGAQTALYAAEHDNALVKAVVLLAPAILENTDAAGYARRYGTPLAPVLEKAQRLINDGKGEAVLDHVNILNCPDTAATAESFASYYGGNARVDTPSLLPKIKKPTLVVVAGSDEVVVGLEPKVTPLTDGTRVQMKVVEGSDHMFRDLNTDDAVDAIDAFLKNIAASLRQKTAP